MSAPPIVTIPERRAYAIARLETAVAAATAELRAYAGSHSGRFVLFGSLARGDFGPHSDIDLMADFTEAEERPARDAAERICRAHGLVPDVHLRSEVGPDLMKRVARDGRDLR